MAVIASEKNENVKACVNERMNSSVRKERTDERQEEQIEKKYKKRNKKSGPCVGGFTFYVERRKDKEKEAKG